MRMLHSLPADMILRFQTEPFGTPGMLSDDLPVMRPTEAVSAARGVHPTCFVSCTAATHFAWQHAWCEGLFVGKESLCPYLKR